MNTSTSLTHFEQRGTITYFRPDSSWELAEGWFYIQGNTVVRRKIGGRNHSAFCSVESVSEFEPYDKEFEKFAKDLKAILSRTREG